MAGAADLLLNKLSSPQNADFIRRKKLDNSLLKRLENVLYVVRSVRNDAEEKRISDLAVREWLHDIRDAVLAADDLLYEVATKAATQREVSNMLSRFPNLHDRGIINKMEEIVITLEYIVTHKDILGLKETARENLTWRAPSTSLVEESNIHGRDQDKAAIIKLLLDENSIDNISVISIWGMGGVGKTTLAQSLYNDVNLRQKFDLKAWVPVSEEFDVLRITKTIIEEITRSNCDLNDLTLLQHDLKEKLTGKKFLFVMDDVWNEDYVDWNILQSPFQHGVKGSKILVTTGSEKVASMVGTIPPYHLNQLSDEDCWLLIVKYACLSSESIGNSSLERIGKEVAKKCMGLPLAAKALGGLLRTKHDIKEWDAILKSDIGDAYAIFDIRPALLISYRYLPAHLKCCFVYCSVYPKDYIFHKDEVISFWMAQGIIQSSKHGKTSEEIANQYFDDLVSRSFLQQSSTSSMSFVMHDLMHDLATYAAEDFFSLERADEIRSLLPSIREDSSNKGTHWFQTLPVPCHTLPTTLPSVVQTQCMVLIRIRNLKIRLELWRLLGFASGVIGLLCQALSPSFNRIIGGWNSFKFFLYGVLVFVICAIILFATECPVSRHGRLKAHVGFVVLVLTSVYSFLYDKAVNGKPDALSMISNGAFAMMSLSLSRLLKLGFEVGLFAFFLGSLAVQLMAINWMLILVAIIYGYPLLLIHSSSNSQEAILAADGGEEMGSIAGDDE